MKPYAFNEEESNKIKEISRLEMLRKNTDSKTEEQEAIEQLNKIDKSFLDGMLIQIKDKFYRVYHSYYGVFKAYGNRMKLWNWSGNQILIKDISKVQFVEENLEWLEDYKGIDYEISKLKEQIRELENKKVSLIPKDFVPLVQPDEFEETDEINHGVINLGGEDTYYSEAFCQLTGLRVTS